MGPESNDKLSAAHMIKDGFLFDTIPIPLDPTVRAWSSFHTGAPALVVVKLVSKELEGRNYKQ